MAREFANYEGIVRRLRAKSPADRFQSAGQLLGTIADLNVRP